MLNNNYKILDLKNFQIDFLLKEDFYIDVLIDDKCYQGFILKKNQNNKFDISYLILPNRTLLKSNMSSKTISFFGDNYFQSNNNIREIILNQKVNKQDLIELYKLLLMKLKEINIDYNIVENIASIIEDNKDDNKNIMENIESENNSLIINYDKNQLNITGYYSYQFFSGFLIDIIVIIKNKLLENRKSSLKNNSYLKLGNDFIQLLNVVLNIFIFALIIGKQNLFKIKNYVQYNRKMILTNKISSILASIESILSNTLIIFCYEYFEYPNIEKQLKHICTLCYEIILKSTKEINNIPHIQFLFSLINFVIYEDNILRIENFDKNKIYKILLTTFQNINVEDIKFIKNISNIETYTFSIIKQLYKKDNNVLFDNCYYTFLINCLKKKNILEKKIAALDKINDIIFNLIKNEDEVNMIFYNFFYNKNKIINLFFEETVHDEILKRASNIFKYLCIYDLLNEEITNKLIKLKNNNNIRYILCEIIKNIKNKDKKNILFNKITQDFNFDNNNNRNNIIEFVSKLTLACFSSIEEYNDSEVNLDKDTENNVSIYNNSSNIKEDLNRRINNNIHLLKMGGIKSINSKNFNNNLNRNYSNEKLLKNSSTIKNFLKKKKSENIIKIINKKNYYGLELLFNYIILNYDQKKALTDNSNILKSINAFKYIIDSSNIIKSKDINYFLDILLDNFISNEKHNSIIQNLALIEILLNRIIYGDTDLLNDTNINGINVSESDNDGEILSELDNKYNIISLIINDLIRYVNKVKSSLDEKKIENDYKNEIFEGIYPYSTNISFRLKILFLFVDFGLYINEIHISKINSLFKSDQFKNERFLFFREITNNIYYIDINTLQQVFNKIFENNKEFDKNNFNDEDTINLILELFIYINLLKETIIDDTKTKRVNKKIDQLVGFNFLFDILISNKAHLIRNKLCNILSHLCLYISNYQKDFCKKYWNRYINKIIDLLILCNKDKNINGIFSLIQLIESIYTLCNNFSWKIPIREETHIVGEPFRLFHFCCSQRQRKEYKLRVGANDKIFHMRWKLAYYYDIPINDLVICDYENNEYNFTNDDLMFYDIFPPKKYLPSETKYIIINVLESQGQILKLPNNPKELIEKDGKIINILVDNLNMKNIDELSKKDDDMMKNLWNITQKLPKKQYIKESILKFGKRDDIPNEELQKVFNVNEIFLLAFNLKCILIFFEGNQYENKNSSKYNEIYEFLENFINFHHIDKIMYKIFNEINIQSKDNNQFIYLEIIKSLLKLIQIIEEYKNKKNILSIFNSNNHDKETIQTKEENINYKEEGDNEYNLDDINSNLNTIIEPQNNIYIMGKGKLFNKLSDIIILILNDNNSSNNLICIELLEELISFIEQLKNNYTNGYKSDNSFGTFFEYIFEKEELFKKIFIYDFIRCTKEEVKKLLRVFLLKNLFDNNNMNIKKRNKLRTGNEAIEQNINKGNFIKHYFDIIMTPEMFNYLVINQSNSSYFNLLSSIVDKYIIYNRKDNKNRAIIDIDNQEEINKFNEKYNKIIDLIIKRLQDINCLNKKEQNLLSFPYKNPSDIKSKNSNSNFEEIEDINNMLLFLLRILEFTSLMSNSVIEYFSNKIDICDFFLLRGIFNKCNENYNNSNSYISYNSDSKRIIFEIIIFLLKLLEENGKNINNNIYMQDSLYMKIWVTLNKYHKLGFWRKKKDWEIRYIDTNKKEFVGLKNMASTCYMNSILQQLFMIPMLRESILNIGKDDEINLDKDSILYQLQLLFASLKLYDFKYYDPKKFVLASKLSFYEQMDADEYYCQLIDKLENEISKINNKEVNNKYINLFKYFLGIKLNDELYFKDCNHKRFNESFCYNIQLEVKNYTNIIDSLKNYFKTEIMTGDNKIICEECKIKRICHKKLVMKTLPNILVISLKRFDYNYTTMTKFKLNNYFEFPFELDLSEFTINNNKNNDIENLGNNNENNLYELTGITIHYGVSDYGHYYDLIKAENNKWYKFNDIYISEFNQNDIPKESFGERENDIDNEREREMNETNLNFKENDKKNAYILIYTKKSFKYSKSNKEYNTNLILPPYDKYTNINNDIKSYINFKIFKYWTLENLANKYYQNFILELLKMDLVKNIHKEIENHNDLIEELRKGQYLPIQNYINTGNTIFSYGLLYFCSIMLRVPKEKNNINICMEILTVYLENDINKCLYILEEFSDNDIMEEFFIKCKNSEVVKTISDLIMIAFKNYSIILDEETDLQHNNINLYKYLNSIILFISNKSSSFSSNIILDNILSLFCNLVNKKKFLLKYLKDKGISNWLNEIIKNVNNDKNEKKLKDKKNSNGIIIDDDEIIYVNSLLTEENFPKLENNHSILKEKANEFNIGKDFMKKSEKNYSTEKSDSKPTKIIKSSDSIKLLIKLQEDINKI